MWLLALELGVAANTQAEADESGADLPQAEGRTVLQNDGTVGKGMLVNLKTRKHT